MLEVENVIKLFARRLEQALTPHEVADDHLDGKYPFIPLPISDFIKWVNYAQGLHQHLYTDWSRPLFLDVGCGIGTKLILAHYLGLPSHGIEINQRYLDIAYEKLGIDSARLIAGDARKFEGYKLYQIIYFYCPMRDPKLQRELEKAIYDGARDGTILIQVLKQNDDAEIEPDLHRLIGPLFIKTQNKQLLRRAKAFFKRKQRKDEDVRF